MQNTFSIFAVDDSEQQRMVLDSISGDDLAVETFASAAQCLARLDTKTPELFLLDVEMPLMDGYELCRRLKSADAATAGIPVIFISAHTDTESRLRGYDCGGEDFIGKPVDMAEVRQKVEIVRRIKRDQAALAARLADSDLLSSLVMTNLDEYAVLIKFLRQLNGCASYREVAEALLSLFKAYRVEGATQIRTNTTSLTLSENGENRPLEASVINHLRGHERIFEFQKRLAVDFDFVTAMINDMPTHDRDLCGRIRDNLAIAVETADARIAAMQTAEAHARTRAHISHVIEDVFGAVRNFGARYDKARYEGGLLGDEMTQDLAGAFSTLALSSEREERILDIVRTKAHMLTNLYDFGDETLAALNGISDRLARVLAPGSDAKPLTPPA